MRAAPDFSAYVLARWTPVVRVLVVLGVPPGRAADLAVVAFARVLPDWSRLRREGDVDVELVRLVLEAWSRDRTTEPDDPDRVPVPVGRVLTRELEEQLAVLGRLTDGLARVDETARLAVALHEFGDLDREQVGDVLGEPRATVDYRISRATLDLDLGPLDPVCHDAAAAIDVPPPSVDRVLAAAAADRRKRGLVWLAVAVAVVLTVGLTFVLTRPDPVPEAAVDSVTITPAANPLDIAWWLDGELHLEPGTVRVPDLAQLVDTGVGVAYADHAGELTVLGDDGIAQHPGRMDPSSALVAQPALGLVAWVDPEGGAVVVYDVVRRRRYATADAADTRIVGWDRQSLYVHREGGDHALGIGPGSRLVDAEVAPPEGAAGSVLQDVAFGTELRTGAGALSVVQPFFSVIRAVPGTSGQLSRDGSFVLTEQDGRSPAVYDAASGEPQGTWFSDDTWTPLAAAWTDSVRVVWVVDSHDGSYGMYECQPSRDWVDSFDPDSQPCTPRVDVDAVPVLAGTQPGLATM